MRTPRPSTWLLRAIAILWSSAAAAQSTTALTLSGWPAIPLSERSTPAIAVGIRFRAPATTALTTARLAWRRNPGGCRLALQADECGAPAAELAAGSVPAGSGWQPVPLSAALVAGAYYHLVARCDGDSFARLAYIVDRTRDAVVAGVWQLEDLRTGVRPRRPPAAPLFALTFADGSWWGQPYRARRRGLRMCQADEVSAMIMPAQAMTVEGVDLPQRTGDAAPADYSLEVIGGRPVSVPLPALVPGTRYMLRLRARVQSDCRRLSTLTTDLPLGRPTAAVNGFQGLGVQTSADGGRTWTPDPATTFAARLRISNGHRTTTTTTRPPTTTTTSSTTTTTRPRTTTTTTTRRRTTTTTTTRRRTTTTSTTTTTRPTTTTTTTRRPTTSTTSTTTTTRPTTTTTRVTTTTTATTTTTLTGRRYRAPYANGYLGYYDANTIPLWPRHLILMFGEANTQGPLVAPAKQVATAAGNGDARFIFYFSLSDMDSRCSCFDQNFYDSFIGSHPEWILRDASGNKVSTSNGIGRVFAADVGNPGYVDAWADWAFAAMARYGWDGTFADNIFRGNFSSWSAYPTNPRTRQPYVVADYRRDMLAALRRLRTRFDARGSILVGNHTSAWDPATFADPVIKDEILAMHGTEVEDCAYDFNGNRRNESGWLAQLAYLDFANQHGVRTICSAPGGAMGDASKRWFTLATSLLTKEGFSSVGEINTVGTWWSGLDADLGAPRGRFYCLDPGAGLTPTASCPSSGKIYGRDWERGRVLVNPTAATTVTVPLGTTLLWQGTPVTSITLGPGSGAVLVTP